MYWICEWCGSYDKLHRHHITYFPCETIYVCWSCHMGFHSKKTKHPLRPPKDHGAIFHSRKDSFDLSFMACVKWLTEPELKMRNVMRKLNREDLVKEEERFSEYYIHNPKKREKKYYYG